MVSYRLTVASALLFLSSTTSAAVIKRDSGAQVNQMNQDAMNPAKQVLWDPTAGPKYQDIAQGSTGDCWLDASMAAVAYADHNRISWIMKDQNDNKGDVQLTLYEDNYDDYKTYTIVKDRRKLNTGGYSVAPAWVTGGNYLWPAVMEQGFRQFAADWSGHGIPGDLNGADPIVAFNAIYGWSCSSLYVPNVSDNDLWFYINKASGSPTVVSTYSSPPLGGIVGDHAYTLFGGDQNAGTVRVRNPWGFVTQDKTWGTPSKGGAGISDQGDGVFDISFADFKANYGWMSVANCALTPS